MVRKDGKYLKSQRMQEIAKAISKTFPEGIEYDKLITLLEFEGYRQDTAERYVLTVLSVKGWSIVDGRIKAE